jgi:hypothetical protein
LLRRKVSNCLAGLKQISVQRQDLNVLTSELDECLVENNQYNEIGEEEELTPLEMIQEEDIQLVCYQWFKPE